MNSFVTVLISNIVVGGGLAVIAFCITKVWRNPHLAHGLWLLVLVKLVTPPIVHVQLPQWVNPPPIREIAEETAPSSRSLPVEVFNTSIQQSDDPSHSKLRSPEHTLLRASERNASDVAGAKVSPFFKSGLLPPWLFVVWCAGSIGLAAVATRQHWLLLRVIAEAKSLEGTLREDAEAVARQLELRRCPQLLITSSLVCPLVSAGWWSQVVLLPSRLLNQLTAEQSRSILAHEFAHIRRRDHLIRRFELVVLALHWWNPMAWWASRKLRQAVEECCDAMVVIALPDTRRSYGQALLQTVEFLTDGPTVLPIAPIGFGKFPFRRRIERIMNMDTRKRTSWLSRSLVLLIGLGTLPFAATAVSQDEGSTRASAAIESESVPDPSPYGGSHASRSTNPQVGKKMMLRLKGANAISLSLHLQKIVDQGHFQFVQEGNGTKSVIIIGPEKLWKKLPFAIKALDDLMFGASADESVIVEMLSPKDYALSSEPNSVSSGKRLVPSDQSPHGDRRDMHNIAPKWESDQRRKAFPGDAPLLVTPDITPLLETPDITASVTLADGNLIVISAGSDNGLRKHFVIHVYRGDLYIAVGEVIQVRRNLALAKITRKFTILEQGDMVATKLLRNNRHVPPRVGLELVVLSFRDDKGQIAKRDAAIKVEGDYIEVSALSDDGLYALQKGLVIEVFRGDRLIAVAQVIRVQPNSVLARITKKLANAAPQNVSSDSSESTPTTLRGESVGTSVENNGIASAQRREAERTRELILDPASHRARALEREAERTRELIQERLNSFSLELNSGREAERTRELIQGWLTTGITYPGILESSEAVLIRSELKGAVQVLFIIEEGSTVKKGDVLVVLDSAPLEDRVQTLKIKVEKARSEEVKAKAFLDEFNDENRNDKNDKTNPMRKVLQAQVDAAEVNLKIEQERLDKVQSQLAKSKIYSPTSGTVIYHRLARRTPPKEGRIVREAQPLLQVVNVSKLHAKVEVHASLLPRVKVGQKVIIKVDGLPDKSFPGQVASIAKNASAASWFNAGVRTHTIHVSLKGSPQLLRPGMTTTVQILTKGTDPIAPDLYPKE